MAGVYNIPAAYSFLDALAQGLLAQTQDTPLELSHYTLFLPTRNDCKELQHAFLRQSHGQPLLLPRMLPLGDLDQEEELILNTPLPGLPSVLPPFKRQGLLTKLILHYTQQHAGLVSPHSAASAAQLAQDLMGLIDEAQVEGVEWKNLADLVPTHLAAHWQITLDFLKIISEHWPRILESTGHVEPHTYNSLAVERLIQRWQSNPPKAPVIAAGSTGTRKTTGRLLKAISQLENGWVLLPGFHKNARDVNSTHPLNAHHQLLEILGSNPNHLSDWPELNTIQASGNSARSHLFLKALELEPHVQNNVSPALENLKVLESSTPQEEALSIALKIREALDTPGQTVSLISPSTGLFERVRSELKRWDIPCEESSQPLKSTLQGSLLLLLLQVAQAPYEAHAVLALLKHPLINSHWVKDVEISILRGPLLKAGIEPLLQAAKHDESLKEHLSHLHEALSPLIEHVQGEDVYLADLLETLLHSARQLVTDDSLLWQGAEGESLSQFFTDLKGAAPEFPELKGSEFQDFLDVLLSRYLYVKPAECHPRLSMLKPFQARLHHADLTILAGLNEGTWPQEANLDPWMNRSMRDDLGLSPPEQKLGLSTHDFYQAFSAQKVLLTRSLRDQGAPTVPSRWLMRLDVALQKTGSTLPRSKSTQKLVSLLDQPTEFLTPLRPQPCPPVHARPRQLSVTQIETWMRDPYALYARHILQLKPLAEIAMAPTAADRGTLFHKAFEQFINDKIPATSNKAYDHLLSIGETLLAPLSNHLDVSFFWWPRFKQVARWFIDEQSLRSPQKTWCEVRGSISFNTPEGPFTLTAKADRIDKDGQGNITLIDYKTGKPPSVKDMQQGLSPQLPLEAAMIINKGFSKVGERLATMEFWWLKGGSEGGILQPYNKDLEQLANEALEGLRHLVTHYDDPSATYPAMPWSTKALTYNDYAHLARIQEWRAAA